MSEPGAAEPGADALRQVEALQGQLDRLRRERDAAVRTAEEAERRLAALYATSTWRAGRAVTWLPRTVKDTARQNPRLRRLLGRAPAPSATGVAVGSRAARLDLAPRAGARAEYERALERQSFSPGATGVVMACSTVDLDEGRGDLYTAVGLGRRLTDLGYEVVYLPPARWYSPPEGARLYVSLVAERDLALDPLALPGDLLRLAWVRNATERWARSPGLPFYDAVLCSSAASQRAIRRAYRGPTTILRIGVDDELFDPGDEPLARTAVTSTVNAWGRERDLHRALREADIAFPLALYGRQHPALGAVLAYAAGTASFFSLPRVYAQSALVLDDVQDVNHRFGNVNSRVFEALACGALPITNSAAGTAEAGLEGVPAYREPGDLGGLVGDWLADAGGRAALVARLRDHVLRDHTYRRRAEEFDEFVRARLLAPAAGPPAEVHPAEVVVGFFPDYRATNPYQDMLYARAAPHGVTTVPVDDPLRVVGSPALRGRPFVFHVHWTAPVLGPATSRRDADARRAAFVHALDALRGQGGRIVWTVHNVLPHECVYPDVEARLRAELASRADAVHVMCPETPALVSEHYALPAERVEVIAHGSYVDVYPNIVTPEQARLELGLGPEHVVLLCLGGIRPYKGVDDLLDAFDIVSRERPAYRLVVAGRPGNFHGVDALRERCEAHPAVLTYFEPVADTDLQVFFTAADVAVLGHRQVLNSGGLQLAWSFGRPAIVPRAGCLTGQVTDEVGRTFEGQDGLVQALRSAERLRTAAVRRASFLRAASYPFTQMSEDFMRLVARLASPAGVIRR